MAEAEDREEDVKAEDTPTHYLAGQDDQAFHIQSPTGDQFSVAKDALHPDIAEQIAGLPPVPGVNVPQGTNSTVMEPNPDPALAAITAGIPPADAAPAPPGVQAGMAAAQGNTEAGHVPQAALANPAVASTGRPIPPTPGPMDQINQSYDVAKGGAELGAQVAQRAADAQYAYLHRINQNEKAYQAQELQRESERRNTVNAATQKLVQLQDENAKAGAMDPKRYWHDLSAGGKVAAGLSIALGAIGGALSGQGGNAAMDIINKNIDRDIESQKMEAAKRQQGIANQSNLISQYRQTFGDERAAEAAARSTRYGQVINQLNEIGAKNAGLQSSAQYLQTKAALQQKQAESNLQMQQIMYQRAAMNQLANGNGSAAALNFLPKDVKESVVPLPGGGMAQAYSPKAAEEARTVGAAHQQMQATLDKMQDLAGSSLPGTDKSRQAKALMSELVFQNQKMEGINRLSEPDIKLLQDQIADPTAMRQDDFKNRLQLMRDSSRNKMEAVYQQNLMGYKPIHERPAR